MQKAHMHVVRVGEFAWTALEPQEGKYDLDWLERAVNLAGKHGLYVILGTPSGAHRGNVSDCYCCHPELLSRSLGARLAKDQSFL
jgi:beta-galactosidase